MTKIQSSKLHTNKKRIENLDLYRAIAILLVIFYHIPQLLLPNLFYKYNTSFEVGSIGVDMFFILSGFLISGLYYGSKDFNNQNMFLFWTKRFLRTYPPYLFMILCYFFMTSVIRPHQHFDIGYLFFIQNFYPHIHFYHVSWSLCVEEHFYIFFALSHHFIKKVDLNKYKNIYLFFLITFAIIPSLLRFYVNHSLIINDKFNFYSTGTFFRFDALSFGCIVRFIIHYYKPKLIVKKINVILVLIPTIILAYYCEKGSYNHIYSPYYLIVIFLLSFILFLLYYTESFTISKFGFVSTIALMAYSLYLTHPIVIDILFYFTRYLKNFNEVSIYLIASLIIFITGYLFYLLVEKKTIDIRNKIVGH